MCVAIPAQVISLGETTAVVERYGERLEVSLLLLDEPVEPNDYLIIQARAFAVRKIDAEEAHETYRLFNEIIDARRAVE